MSKPKSIFLSSLHKRKKERKHTTQGRDGRTARRHAPPYRDFKERSVVLALAHPNPWSSASFYLPSQSLADSRCNLHATSRIDVRGPVASNRRPIPVAHYRGNTHIPTSKVPRRTSSVRNLRRPWAPREYSPEKTKKKPSHPLLAQCPPLCVSP